MFINHTQTSQGFSGSLSVGVWDAKASGGDEPGFHVRIAGALPYKDHYVTPKGVPGVVNPPEYTYREYNSNAFQTVKQ